MLLSREKKKNLMLVLASLLLSLVLGVVAGEAILNAKYERWKSHYVNSSEWYGGLTTLSKNPILMWEYRPNAESRFPESRMDWPVIRTNRYGFRDNNYEFIGRPAEVFRISFIGDSVTLG